jgi:hypothetical protein
MRFEERGDLKKVGWSEGNRVCEGELDFKGVFFGLGFQVFLEKGASICVVMEFIALNFGWGSVGWVGVSVDPELRDLKALSRCFP